MTARRRIDIRSLSFAIGGALLAIVSYSALYAMLLLLAGAEVLHWIRWRELEV